MDITRGFRTALAAAVLISTASVGLARRPAAPSPDVRAVVGGGNAFAVELYAQLARKAKGNLFFSPSSIHTALAMTYAGARGRTADQMAGTLHYPREGKRLHSAFGSLLETLNNPRTDHRKKPVYELVVSNALWAQKGYPFREEFVALVQASYGAGLTELDYRRPEPARVQINDWVADQTKQKILNLIPRGVITPRTRLVLTNAIYFKSNWADTFSERATRDEAFKLSAGRGVQTPMMRRQGRYGYLETPAFQALELPYRFGELSMVVLLPRETDGLPALEKRLTAKSLTKWLADLRRETVRVTLPKFKFTSQFRLPAVLRAMGMVEAFDAGRANFSGMTTMEKLFISDVIHKAFVAVDEKGTEAAAATAVIMALKAAMPRPVQPKVFRADHPFVFLIRHRATGSVLFLGRVADPKK
jgi:serpin B